MNEEVRRLIEVAFPLEQASLDSVHEEKVRHGHPAPAGGPKFRVRGPRPAVRRLWTWHSWRRCVSPTASTTTRTARRTC